MKTKWLGVCRLAVAGLSFAAAAAIAQPPAPLILQVRDYVALPSTEKLDPTTQTQGELSRVNFLREEPGHDRGRLFLSNLNGPLYILDKRTKELTTYLDFNGREGHKGMFHRLAWERQPSSPAKRSQREIIPTIYFRLAKRTPCKSAKAVHSMLNFVL